MKGRVFITNFTFSWHVIKQMQWNSGMLTLMWTCCRPQCLMAFWEREKNINGPTAFRPWALRLPHLEGILASYLTVLRSMLINKCLTKRTVHVVGHVISVILLHFTFDLPGPVSNVTLELNLSWHTLTNHSVYCRCFFLTRL